MAQLVSVRLNKSNQEPLGFRLQGGKDFGTPLVVQKVNGGSAAERAGLQAGDALIRVNATDVYTLRHQDAQDTIRAAGPALELTVQRGGGTWRPAVTPTGSLPRPGSRPLGGTPTPVTNTSLKATPQASRAFGSGHNNVAKPFGYMNGNDSVKSIVNKQYNTPVNIYSDKTIAETLSAQTEVLATGALGVNFKKNEKTYDAEKSAVFKVLQEEQSDPEPVANETGSYGHAPAPAPPSGLRSVQAPVTRPDAPINNTGGLPVGQNICEECERLITGVFVRIKDKNLHVECFKCSTCGSSLKNQGYYNLNGKLYCDIHAKLVARQYPPAPNLEPVTVPPGSRIPTNTYSTPLPPLTTTNYSNGSSSLFSPNSNVSGPKPFGSSIGSAYSPSLSPRSAPMSPARPVAAPAPTSYAPAAPAPASYAPPAPAPATYAVPPSYGPPASAPAYTTPAPAPAPVAPFASTQNVKSIVWPPPNPLEDEQPKREISPIPAISVPELVNNMNNGSSGQTVSLQQSKNHTSTSQQQKEFSANISSISSALSSMAASSSKSETKSESSSIMQSNQSQTVQETNSCTVQSFTEESSSASQSMTVYQSESGPFVQHIENTVKCVEAMQSNKNKQSVKVAEKRFLSENEDKNIKTNNPSPKDHIQERTQSNVKNTVADQAYDNIIQQKENIIAQNNKIVIKTENATLENIQVVGKADKTYEKDDVVEKQCSNLSVSSQVVNDNLSQLRESSMIQALTTAPDRPYSPLPALQQPFNINMTNVGCVEMPAHQKELNTNTEQTYQLVDVPTTAPESTPGTTQQSLMFTQQPNRPISPIPPIKQYNPPEKPGEPVPMPQETAPYVPPDFKINIDSQRIAQRQMTESPMIDALTTAPDRPFTPVAMSSAPIERGSLKDALTIAPEFPYSPLPLNTSYEASHYTSSTTTSSTSTMQMQSTSSEIVRPIATQTQMSNKNSSELSSMQNMFQTSTETSAFKPVPKQVFPPPQPEAFCKLSNFPPISNDLKTSFAKQTSNSQQEMSVSESVTVQSAMTSSCMNKQGYSAVKTAQNYFEQLDQKENLCSTSVRSKSGLHKPDSIPTYQKNFEMLPSQRGITPELCNAPAVLQRPVSPTSNPPTKTRGKSQEPKSAYPAPVPSYKVPQYETSVQQTLYQQMPYQQPLLNPTPYQPAPKQCQSDTPITMTFQPVSEETFLRVSPNRSRPSTPSMINKPAPIIPHYQMNLVTVEHLAPECHLFEPSSPEVSRSPTPKPRSRSPAQGPPQNPLKAQAPRIKENTPQRQPHHTLLSQATSNLRREHEMAQNDNPANVDVYNESGVKSWGQDQPSVIKEQNYSNTGFKSENYRAGDFQVKEDSLNQQNFAQRQMQSQNVSEFGNTKVQTTRKTFEEYERTQSAKVVEIRKGGSSASNTYQYMDCNMRPSNINAKQVFPPPVISVPTSQGSSVNHTNANVATASRKLEDYPPKPSISGANQDPACDPTPSTGSSVGAAARGKTFGVSSAPKRGRGVLNKAAMPGSRVPLCASCNGNIRGPFITALGRIWCPEHFICVNATCKRPLQDIGFVEENGQLYCEYCFEQYIAPACDKCHAKIKGDCLNAIGKHFHPECFACVYCGKLFGNNPFFLEDGLPYCESDWNELFTTKCFACGFPVEAGDRWVEALNNNYHSQCFNCTVCKKNLEGQSFFAKGGRPFCKTHAR